MTTVDIVIVNWNAGNQLRECLASIAQTAPGGSLGRVVVVDNASTDGSCSGVEAMELPLKVIYNRSNRGFAAACNQGAAEGSAPFVLFLNPDTRLDAHSLSVPVEFLSDPTHTGVGICGIQLCDDRGEVARSCAPLPTSGTFLALSLGLSRLAPRWFPCLHMSHWDHATTRDVDHVMGAFFLVRRPLFAQLRGFDERFFVYFEDIEFSLRAREAGWRTVYLADARAYHRGRGTTEQAKARRLFYSLRSRILYAAKHFSRLGAAAVLGTALLIEPWTRLGWSIVRLAPREVWETLRGFLLLWGDLPHILATAWRHQTS